MEIKKIDSPRFQITLSKEELSDLRTVGGWAGNVADKVQEYSYCSETKRQRIVDLLKEIYYGGNDN